MAESLPHFLKDVSPEFLCALEQLVQIHSEDVARVQSHSADFTRVCSGMEQPTQTGLTEQPMLKESPRLAESAHMEEDNGCTGYGGRGASVVMVKSKSDADCNMKEGSGKLCKESIGWKASVGSLESPFSSGVSKLVNLAGGSAQDQKEEGMMVEGEDGVSRWQVIDEKKRANAATGPSGEVSLFGNVAEQLGDGTEIDQPAYDVCNFYKTTGFAQAVARNSVFGDLTLFIICLNAVFLGVESDFTRDGKADEDARVPLLICSNVFCVFFLVEWVCRFFAFAHKKDCYRDGWFKFDSFLVFTMLLDTWVMPILEIILGFEGDLPGIGLLRLLRLARMVRICHALPELATLMKGIFVATRAVGSAILLLIVIIYAWAIAMHTLLKDDEDVFWYWGTVTRCMMTLIANGTLGDSIGTVMRGIARNVPALSFFLAFVLLSAITVTNMLIGLLCEVVSEVANAEKEHATLFKLKSTLLVTLKRVDKDGSGDISRDEMLGLLNDQSARTVLGELGIDAKHLSEFTDMIFSPQPGQVGEKCMSITEVMQMLLDSQGQRQPNFQDLVSMLSFTRWSIQQDILSVKSDMSSIKGDIKKDLAAVISLRSQANKVTSRL